jgi:muramidase (phage lysozyme)
MSTNRTAFLDMIAHSEIGAALLAVSDNGYNVVVGSTARNPILFSSYSDHPRRLVRLNAHLSSTAAGRYQVLERYFDAYKKQLDLTDFSPANQDIIAIQQLREKGALPLIDAGQFAGAVTKASAIWASLPGALYGQHTNDLTDLQAVYVGAGGKLS